MALDPQRQERARRYATIKRRLALLEMALASGLLALLAFTNLSRSIVALLPHLTPPLVAGLYGAVLVLGYSLLLSPLTYYQDYVLPKRYEVLTQKLGGWLEDELKTGILELVMGAVALAALYSLLDRSPDLWWLLSAALFLLVTVLFSGLLPTLFLGWLIPLRKLEEGELRSRLISLAEKAGARVNDILVMELSRKGNIANALLAGMGRRRRIILSDTLISQYTPEEVESILAHELGHQLHHDILRLLALRAVLVVSILYLTHLWLGGSVATLGLQGVADVAGLPLLVLYLGVLGFLSLPAGNSYSRRREADADRFALKLTGNPTAFVSAMTRLCEQNLCEAQPAPWAEFLFNTHPSYQKRIKLASGYEQPATTHFPTMLDRHGKDEQLGP